MKKEAAAVFLLAVAIHTAWAFTIPAPSDWDPAYYRTVAMHVVSGDGAVSGSLWNLLWLPPALPMPADVHWMPLPSRVLVPGLWIWPAHGDQVVTVLLAACWAPLALLIAEKLGAERRWAVIAGVLAATGGAYARFVSTPDCIALYGAIGGAALWMLAERRWAAVAMLASLAALTRGDGFILGPCLAIGVWLSGERRWAASVAVAGPLMALVWNLRNLWIVGEGYFAMRQATANAIEVEGLTDLVLGTAPALGIGDRFAFLLNEGLPDALIVWLVVLPLPSMLIWARKEPVARAAAAYWLLGPLVTILLAPGVAASGSLFRSGSALFAIAVAVAVLAMRDLGRWTEAKRGLHPAFVPVLLGAPLVGLTVMLPFGAVGGKSPLGPEVCAEVATVPPGEPIFTVHPLLMEANCGHPGVVWIDGMDAATMADLAERYDVHWALTRPDEDPYQPAPADGDVEPVLPGWTSDGDHLFSDAR